MIVPHDKKLHFLAGFLISFLTGCVCMWWGWPSWLTVAVAALAGALKEGWDVLGHGDCDAWDFAATLVGGALPWIALSVVRAAL